MDNLIFSAIRLITDAKARPELCAHGLDKLEEYGLKRRSAVADIDFGYRYFHPPAFRYEQRFRLLSQCS